MKKLFSLFLLLSCLSFATAQAQGVYVTGSVTDSNGDAVTDVIGFVEGDCGIFDSLFVDNQGYYEYASDVDSCIQGAVWVVFYCQNGNAAEGVGYFSPNTPTVSIDIVLNCGPTQNDCSVSFSNIDSLGTTLLEAYISGGVAPYTYEWFMNGNVVSSAQYLELSNTVPGTYSICVVATGADGSVCEYCDDVTVGEQTSCWAGFDFIPSDPGAGNGLLAGWVEGGTAPYTYLWSDGSTSQYLDLANYSAGTYTFCLTVTDSNGETCETCDVVIVNGGQTECYLGFNTIEDSLGLSLYAWNQGNSGPYTYEWWVGNQVFTGQSIDLSNLGAGTYDVCVLSTDTVGNLCEYCDVITIGGQNNDCYTGFSLDGDAVYGWTQGGTAPYVYTWSDGSTGEVLDVSGYAPGVYTLCLSVVDANGMTCEYCDVITIAGGPVDECLDWNVIDLANAPCNFDYNPVCGCDGIEYTNACVAYYCYGITEWTEGPCDYSGGGNGEPTDTLCETTAEFFYYGELNASGGYDVFFFGFGEDTNEYIWEMGDGTDYYGEFVEHTYASNGQDSIEAYTVCLTTISWDSCSATICETIVLDSTPGGFIGGEVVDGEQFTGGSEVERVTSTEGDPLAEVTVELQDWNGNVIATTTTNEFGEYAFSGLLFGDYFVHVNIDGVEHTPDHIKLSPVLQNVDDNSYEVMGGQVTSGIDGVSFAAGINVAPNPTSGQLNVAMELAANVDIRIVVTDILGKVVQQEVNSYTQGSQTVELNLEDLVSGIYMVSLQANGEVYTTKVLKQ